MKGPAWLEKRGWPMKLCQMAAHTAAQGFSVSGHQTWQGRSRLMQRV